MIGASRMDGAGVGRCTTPCPKCRNSAGPRRKAYWSEQILSSSLFRLYRSIGGDTTWSTMPRTPDPYARRSASHYCVYLIMRGIQILGTSLVVPANEPDQFVSALIDADINTASSTPVARCFTRFSCLASLRRSRYFRQVGGCVHKVIRWAFEAQGLYNPFGKITNAPGEPPPRRRLHRGSSADFGNHAVRQHRLWARKLQSGFA